MCMYTYTKLSVAVPGRSGGGRKGHRPTFHSFYFIIIIELIFFSFNPFVIWSLTCIDDESVVVVDVDEVYSFTFVCVCVNFSRDLLALKKYHMYTYNWQEAVCCAVCLR